MGVRLHLADKKTFTQMHPLLIPCCTALITMLSSAPPGASETVTFSCDVASASGTPVVQTGTATLTSIGWTVLGGGGSVRVSPTDSMTLECGPPLEIGKVANGGGLPPIEIEEVISDQIAGNDANKLPTAYFKNEPNNPMLIATRAGQKAKLRVKMASADSKVFIGARKVGQQTVLGSVSVTTSVVPLEFDVPAFSHDMYEVVAGYDTNANMALDDAEAKIVFEKTPKKDDSGAATTDNLSILDKIVIVDKDQFDDSQSTAIAWFDFPGTEYAGDLISGFARGVRTIPNATCTDPIPISSTTFGLSHPLGAKWNVSNTDSTYRFTFADKSPASDDIEESSALEQIVKKQIADNKASMIAAYSGAQEWQVTPPYRFTEEKKLLTTENDIIGINELGVSFGKVTFHGVLRIRYKKLNGSSIEVADVEVIGAFDDLYDFAYGGGLLARQASMVQAGHASLASGTRSDSGKVFFTRLEFDTGFVNTWSGTY